MDFIVVGIFVFMAGGFLGYALYRHSAGKLSAEQRHTLSVNMHSARLRYLWGALAAAALFLPVHFLMPTLRGLSFLGFVVAMVALTLGMEIYSWRRSRVGTLHRAFVMPFLISRIIVVSGTLVLIAAVAVAALMAAISR